MFSQRILRLSANPSLVARPYAGASARYLHSTSIARTGGTEAPGRDPRLSQGTVRKEENLHPGDPQDQAARSGQSNADKSPLDAASKQRGKQATREGLSGNAEGVGFAEQVGSASSSGSGGSRNAAEGAGGKEEATPPGFLDAVKSTLGFKTTSGEVKQNRDGGEGVTGTGTFAGLKGEQKQHKNAGRGFHTSARAAMAGDKTTTGQAPEASRQPKDRTYAEQNEHLKHREETDSSRASKGKGNAAEDPYLPSHKLGDKSNPGQQRRSLHTSTRRLEEKHTAESYFKDVDTSPPQSSKTHQVDSSDNKLATPDEPEAGESSDKGMQTKEYQTVDKDEPYDLPGKDDEQKLTYGG
ncbi:uncharacterized protein C8Q71DRAFT_673650, partial [Rhodofomes roseus]